ncbi:MAG: ACT domain-containing protein [Paludibacteraceae bacterium]|nr:ACT domain-containing protein [Paludibacteraceae bacterium]
MQIKQLSVFLENKGGRLNDVANILGEAGINMSAFSLAESSDFGILRVIVSDPVKAQAILKENKFAVSLTDVICVHVPNSPGSLAKILNIITDNGISIDYMYAFAECADANVIIKPDKTEDCIDILQKNKIALIAADELYKI